MDSVQPQITEHQDSLSKQMNDLSQKVVDLSVEQQPLQQSVQNMSPQIVESASNVDTTTTHNTNIATPRCALDIV